MNFPSSWTSSCITAPKHTFLSYCRLESCSLSKISCEALGLALKKNPSNLTELDLTFNNLQDSGVLHLCGFLESPDCRLQTLRLKDCSLSEISCQALVSALKNNPSNLTELDLSQDNLQDSGVLRLCGFLESPDCKLQTLRSDFRFHMCSDKYDVLTHSDQKCPDSDLQQLVAKLSADICSGFRLNQCSLSKTSCASLVSALKSNPSHLTELDLNWNNLQSSDVQQLQDLVESPNSKLQTLRSVEGWSQSSCFQMFGPKVSLREKMQSFL
uniref:Uncharacterized protein n=1 Tax=Oryzias sinensis TaxID=183150 RepID=A0A8C7WYF4_9TELE